MNRLTFILCALFALYGSFEAEQKPNFIVILAVNRAKHATST